MTTNTISNNAALPIIIAGLAQWHHDKGIVFESSDEYQFTKALEEITEVHDAIQKGDEENLEEEIADVIVVLINMMERHSFVMEDIMKKALNKISHRTGHVENGTFIKDHH